MAEKKALRPTARSDSPSTSAQLFEPLASLLAGDACETHLRGAVQLLRRMFDAISDPLILVAPPGVIQAVNPATCALLGYASDALIGKPFPCIIDLGTDAGDNGTAALQMLLIQKQEVHLIASNRGQIPVLFSGAPMRAEGGALDAVVCSAVDLRQRKELEHEFRQAHKLESVGRLAAGIAHEINTPIQFIGDSVHFLDEAFADCESVADAYRALRDVAKTNAALAPLLEKIAATEGAVDMDFLRSEIPQSIRRILGGVQRVSSIVSAMKDFAHPGSAEKEAGNLNHAVETTLAVARNEYKYVADVDLDLAEIPAVFCSTGDLNQILLNLIVNAANAIEDRVGGSGERGRIRIRTHREGDHVVLEIRDTGCGIPIAIRDKIFDPFFTTKDVGRGSGQGLAISRQLIVERYAGDISFTSEVGVGTTFSVRLRIAGEEAP